MAERKTDAQRLAELQARIAAMQAKAEAIEARKREAERRTDTRRKILLGAYLIDAASKDERYGRVIQQLIGRMSREIDKKAFEGFEVPAPGVSGESTPDAAAEGGRSYEAQT